jgi:hypothetical protein
MHKLPHSLDNQSFVNDFSKYSLLSDPKKVAGWTGTESVKCDRHRARMTLVLDNVADQSKDEVRGG